MLNSKVKVIFFTVIILVCAVFVLPSSIKAFSLPFSFLSSNIRFDVYTDQFKKEYMANLEKVNPKEAKNSFNTFKEAYFLWIDNYIYEITDERKQAFIEEAKKALTEYFVFSKEENKAIEPKKAMDFVMGKIFNDIDAHTAWMSAGDSKLFLERLNGQYKGIGILFHFDSKKNMILVAKVFENSPAKQAGIVKGDYIYAVNGNNIKPDDKLEDVVNSIKGENGTYVDISIKRGDRDIKAVVKRGEYYVPSVESFVLENQYGYININSFNNDTASLFRISLNTLNVNNLKGLIIDLRGNPGGLLTAVILIANSFLSGENIVAIKGRTVDRNQTFMAMNKAQVDQNLPIVILINSMSASASELLTGALALNNRAFVIGENSFGKWSVQSSFNLDDKSIFNVTTQLFYAPKNATFQGIGIAPDIEVLNKYSNRSFREKNYDNYLQTSDVNNIRRTPKLKVQEQQCGSQIYEQHDDMPDYTLNCGILFLKTMNIKSFKEKLAKP